jgi:hypothetical protein
VYSGGSARAARAALFALVCVGAGTALHRLADGCDPGWVGPGLALPIVWLAAFGLARRERPTPVVMLALGVAQLGLHVELGWFCPPGQNAVPGMPYAMPGMPTGFGVAATSARSVSSMHSTAAMLVAHALAVLICGWWLGMGERSFFELCRVLARVTCRAAERAAALVAAVCGSRVRPVTSRPRLFHATALRNARPVVCPAPSPRVLRGPPPAAVPS